jgi:hypothetical protein
MANATSSAEYQNNHTATVGGTTVSATTLIIAKDCTTSSGNYTTISSTSNIYGVSGTNVEVNLGAGTNSIERTGNKTIIPLLLPTTDKNQAANTPNRTFIDLKRVEQLFIIKGVLSDDSGNITGTSIANSALNKAVFLLAMEEESGPIRLYYRNEAIMCILKQVRISDKYIDVSTNDAGDQLVAKYDFEVQLWIGKPR